MNHSEAGRLGGIAAAKQNIKKKNALRYAQNPKRCKHCDAIIGYDQRRNDFCNRSCAASYNNLGIAHNPRKRGHRRSCLVCDKLLVDGQYKFCSSDCSALGQQQRRWREIETHGFIADTARQSGRVYLVHKRGHRCEICGRTEWTGQPIPLVLDHIDGNHKNGLLTNLRLICPNCDALLPTYKGRNKGSGRSYRRAMHP